MSEPSFYHPDLAGDESSVVLSPEESRHIGSARRLAHSDRIQLMNGRGGIAQAEITKLDKRHCEAKLLSWQQYARPEQSIIIATAIPKPDRQRFMVEALVQLGVTHLVPLNCQRSITRSDHKSLQKWARYASEAMKQSQNPWMLQIENGADLQDVLEKSTHSDQQQRYFADLEDAGTAALQPEFESRYLLVGPEGGFSASEREYIVANGFLPLRLAKPILRTEVAAIVGAARLLPPVTG